MTHTFVDWRSLDEDDDDGWDQLRCLYAYFSPKEEVLYIGKAWSKTVYARWRRQAKEGFWDDLEHERRIFNHRVAVGTVALLAGKRLSHKLLCDIESLLIFEIGPWGNIQGRDQRIARPGLIVKCRGLSWTHKRRVFRDENAAPFRDRLEMGIARQ